jgi:hypothetical protein
VTNSGSAEFYMLKQGNFLSTAFPDGCYWSSPPAEKTTEGPVNLPISMIQFGDSVAAGEGTQYGYTRSSSCGTGSVARWCPLPRQTNDDFYDDSKWLDPFPRCHRSPHAYSENVARDANAFPAFAPNGERTGPANTAHGGPTSGRVNDDLTPAVNLLNLACTGARYEAFGSSPYDEGGGLTRHEMFDSDDGYFWKQPAEFGNWNSRTQLNHNYFEASPNLVHIVTGPNDVRFVPIVTACITNDLAANALISLGTSLSALLNPVTALVGAAMVDAGVLLYERCTASNGPYSEFWDPNIGSIQPNLQTLATWIRERAKAAYAPPPKILLLNYFMPINSISTDHEGWCPDDWIGARLRLGRLFRTVLQSQRDSWMGAAHFGAMNANIEAAYSQVKTAMPDVGFVDLHGAIAHHEWCSEGTDATDPNSNGSWAYSLIPQSPPETRSQAPFHPTICGQEHYAALIAPQVAILLGQPTPPQTGIPCHDP